ncbi:MAG: Rieske (2Fe-2S) protein [Deltaproteobacteria bacterium]|nr:Rieske (2Fe-2S) protein [Deltaproteobacteria bacterium]
MLTPPFPVTLSDERRLDRRRFLAALGAGALLASGGAWFARRRDARAGVTTAIAAATVADLAPGEARVVAGGGGEALVVRLNDGAVAAFDRRCPHLGCPVVWAAANGRFECPCHGAAFDARTGGVLFGPPRTGLRPITITVDEED